MGIGGPLLSAAAVFLIRPVAITDEQWEQLAGTGADTREPQELFSDETPDQALRQLTLYGPSGLPVLSDDRQHIQGWIDRHNILDALSKTVQVSGRSIEQGALAAADPSLAVHQSSTPLTECQIVGLTIPANSPALGRRAEGISWPHRTFV